MYEDMYSLYKSGDRWVGQVKIGTYENGKQKYKRFYAQRQKDVVRRVIEYLENDYILNNTNKKIGGATVEAFLTWYLKEIKVHQLKKTSWHREENTLESHILPRIGHYRLNQLTSEIIQSQLLQNLKDNGYSYSTVHKAYVFLNAALKYAQIQNRIKTNPCDGVIAPKKKLFKKGEVRFLNEEEISLLKEKALEKNEKGQYKYEAGRMIVFALHTGMRAGELCGLQWKDINFKNSTARINKVSATIYIDKKRTVTLEESTKSESSDRVIPLNDTAIEMLNIQKSAYPGGKAIPTDFITTNSSKIMRVDLISQRYNSLAKAAGIPNPKGIHTLRHTFASMMLKKGVDIKLVSEILGHSTIAITYENYIHILNEQKARAVALIDF